MSKLKITLLRSLIGRQKKQRLIVQSLGLRRIRHSVIRPDNPQVRGMIEAVRHLVAVEPIEEGEEHGTETA